MSDQWTCCCQREDRPVWPGEPTAKIHQPGSSSRNTIRDLSVSMDSTGSPFEKLLFFVSAIHQRYCPAHPGLPGEIDHALRQPNLPQPLVLRRAQCISTRGIRSSALLPIRACVVCSMGVVVNQLVRKALIGGAEGRVVDGEKGKLRRLYVQQVV